MVMIHRGRKVLDEPMAGLRRQYDPRIIRVEPLDEASPLPSLRQVPGVARGAADGRRLRGPPAAGHRPGGGDAADRRDAFRSRASSCRGSGSRTCSSGWSRRDTRAARPSGRSAPNLQGLGSEGALA